MNPFVIVRSLLAVGGAAALLVVVARKFKMMGGDDAPIRVKGGSVVIENDWFPWTLDEEDDEPEYHQEAPDTPNGWNVRAWHTYADFTARSSRACNARDAGQSSNSIPDPS